MEYYHGLFDHFDEEEKQGETIIGGENPDLEESESAKEAGMAFDNMMDSADKQAEKLVNSIWTFGGNT